MVRGLASLGGALNRYLIELSPDAMRHLRVLSSRDRRIALDGMAAYLAHEPMVPTRNRKEMRPNPFAPWELRLGRLRVYYEAEDAPDRRVLVRAVGVKERNVVLCGREVFKI
jgi:mRNA-degrading endonuclease RelE of RelBE toxin-antitoxin system